MTKLFSLPLFAEKYVLGIIILLGFKDNQIQEMTLLDSFGHHTKIVFTNVEVNPSLNEKSFLFKVPKGVDVVGE